MPRVLVIDDDVNQLEILCVILKSQGYEVFTAVDAMEGITSVAGNNPDLILLDINLPGMDGLITCKRLRELTDTPIIICSVTGDEEAIVSAFREGANDFLVKPVKRVELVERINARIRDHENHRNHDNYLDKSLLVDLTHRKVIRNGHVVHLTPVEYKLLCCLVSHNGKVVSHKQILQEVWGHCYLDGMTNLSLYIHYLREKLEDDPENPVYILNEWGNGYWFDARKIEQESLNENSAFT